MNLLTREKIERLFREVAAILSEPAEILLVGGSAVLAWCPDGTATKDIDAMMTEDFDVFLEAVRRLNRQGEAEPVDVNNRSDGFEVYFPEDWRDHLREAPSLSSDKLRVLVPRPEDLAVAKVFRLVSKDADDIKRLAGLTSFDRGRFLSGFLNVLPASIGSPHVHAQSFAMVWNRLFPGEHLQIEDILDLAGIPADL